MRCPFGGQIELGLGNLGVLWGGGDSLRGDMHLLKNKVLFTVLVSSCHRTLLSSRRLLRSSRTLNFRILMVTW